MSALMTQACGYILSLQSPQKTKRSSYPKEGVVKFFRINVGYIDEVFGAINL